MNALNEDERRADRLAAAQARLQELSARFVARSRNEVVDIRGAIARVRAGDASGLGVIQHLAHRMAGTGATLGLDALSHHAYELERLAEAQNATLPDAAVLARMDVLISALEDAARSAAGS